ncbi:MAG: hypothetical protein AAGH15_11645, partial [Myxococcota bacterium]
MPALLRMAFALLLVAAACDGEELRPPAVSPPPTMPGDPPPVYDPQPPEAPPPARRIVEAFRYDREYARDRPVAARRMVYRVTLGVPKSLGGGHDSIARPAAELAIDVSENRLRARFQGGAWPVPEGSEVRLRADAPGSYVFDDEGGRPFAPGQLANWFEGGPLRFSPRLYVRSPEAQSGPGRLICRLLAEWVNGSPDVVGRRCGRGGSPPFFRVGLWRAERTADVAVSLPARMLRADHE